MARGGNANIVYVWDVQSQNLTATLTGHRSHVNAVAISPDGSTIASAGHDHVVLLRSIDKNRPSDLLISETAASGGGHWKTSLTFSLDSVQLLAACDGYFKETAGVSGSIRLFNLSTGRIRDWPEANLGIHSISLSPDGELLAAGGRNVVSGEGKVELWRWKTGERYASFAAHAARVSAVAFSEDGRLLASADGAGKVAIWDVDAKQPRAILSSLPTASVAFSPDGRILALGTGNKSPGAIQLWDVPARRLLATLDAHNGAAVACLDFTTDGSVLISGGLDSTAMLWDVPTRSPRKILLGHTHWVLTTALSPDEKTLATGGGDGTVRLWQMPSGDAIATLKMDLGVTSLAFSPDGKNLGAGSADTSITLWSAYCPTGRPLASAQPPTTETSIWESVP